MSSDDQAKRHFEQAVDLYADSLYRVAFRLTGRQELAVELVQETFLQAWQNLASLRDREKLKGWLFQILRFQYSKLLRRESRHRLPGVVSVDELPDPRAAGQADSRESTVQAALAQLSDDFRLPILLVSMEGLSVEEAAGALGLPRGTVLSRLHRGREKLKALLERDPEFRDCQTRR